MTTRFLSIALLAAWFISGCSAEETALECNQGNCDETDIATPCDEIGVAGRCTNGAVEYCLEGEVYEESCTGTVGVGRCAISDEGHAYCENFCALEEFMCFDGGCIAQNDKCNGFAECRDQSDEDQTMCEIFNAPLEGCEWLKGRNFRACSGGTDWDPGCGWQFCLPNGTWSEDCDAKPEVYPCLDEGLTCQPDAICR